MNRRDLFHLLQIIDFAQKFIFDKYDIPHNLKIKYF